MGLVYHRSGQITERTRWNLSFSGVSLSQKRGRLTLNTRGRSNFRVAKGLNLRVHTSVAFVLWIVFLLWDLLVLLLKGVTFVVAAPIEFLYYRFSDLFENKKKDPPAPKPKVIERGTSVSSLNRDSELGTYDLKTETRVYYELHLGPTEARAFLDNVFGEASVQEGAKGLLLHDFTIVVGKRGRFVAEKTPGKASVLYTPRIVEIVKVVTAPHTAKQN